MSAPAARCCAYPKILKRCPASARSARFDRAIASEMTTTIDEERARMHGGTWHNGATVLYQLEDFELREGWLSSKGGRTFQLQPPVALVRRTAGRGGAGRVCLHIRGSFTSRTGWQTICPTLEAERHASRVTTARALSNTSSATWSFLACAQPLVRARFRTLVWIDKVLQNSYLALQHRSG
jgi:hypothetical protein